MSKRKLKQKFLVQANGPEIEESSADDLYAGRQQKYLLVNMISRRARDLNKGATSLVPRKPGQSFIQLAEEEVAAGTLNIHQRQTNKVYVSLIKND